MSEANVSHIIKREPVEESAEHSTTIKLEKEFPENRQVIKPSTSLCFINADHTKVILVPVVAIRRPKQEQEKAEVTQFTSKTIVKEELIIEDINESEDASDDSRIPDGSKDLFCQECNKTFNCRRSYNTHRLRHSNIKNIKYPCSYCERPFATRRDLTRHVHRVHFESSARSAVANRIRKCPLCPTLSDTNDSYRSHLLTHEQQLQSMFRCEFCSMCFGEQDALRQHVTLEQCEKLPKYDVVEENGMFKCGECNQAFLLRRLCQQHIRRHSAIRNKTFECDTCGKLYGTNSELLRHARSHGGEPTASKPKPSVPSETETTKLYRCSECPKTFLDLAGCERHIRRHENVRNGTFRCGECGKCYGRDTELRKHILAHKKKQA